jgi:hypothetical protein
LTAEGLAGAAGRFTVADIATFVKNHSAKAVATLFGGGGNTMCCRFRLSSAEGGMSGGGLGERRMSNGEKIDVSF